MDACSERRRYPANRCCPIRRPPELGCSRTGSDSDATAIGDYSHPDRRSGNESASVSVFQVDPVAPPCPVPESSVLVGLLSQLSTETLWDGQTVDERQDSACTRSFARHGEDKSPLWKRAIIAHSAEAENRAHTPRTVTKGLKLRADPDRSGTNARDSGTFLR